MKKIHENLRRFGKHILLVISIALGILFCHNGVFAETYDEIVDATYNLRKESIYNIDLNAPFSKEKSGIREGVDPETGAVTVSFDIFSFKGLGGEVEENFTLLYCNNYASDKEETVEYSESEQEYLNTTSNKSTFEQSIEKFGIGWRMNLPHVEIPNEKNKTKVYVYMPDGRVFKSANTDCGLEDYALSDVQFRKIEEEISDKTMSYVLNYVNGDTYYFDTKGYLCRKSDKYNNVIDYKWSGGSVPALEAISSNWGDLIQFTYTDSVININYKERQYKIFRSVAGDSYVIDSIIDPQGRKTEFGYMQSKLKFDYFSRAERTKNGQNTYWLLNEIKYSSGLETYYEYVISKKWLYEEENGFIEYSKISARYDKEDGNNVNRVTYEYVNQPDGFPKHKSSNLPLEYTYFTIETDSLGTKSQYVYNSKHYQTEITKSANGKASEKEVRKYDALTEMPDLFERTIYYQDGNSKTEFEAVKFDSRGNVVYSNTYTDAENVQNDIRTYEYSYGTNMCVYESYMKDKETKVEKRRTLNQGGNSFTSETTYENGREIKRDEFEYTSNGKLTMSKIQTGKTDYLITKYTYDSKRSYKYPSRIVLSGIRDADGNIESYVTEYEYDDYGNCVKVIDDNKNITRYTYDSLNRNTKETLEDGKSRETRYADKENKITTIDANGLKLLYFYDKCGKLIKVYDESSAEILLTREYDEKERLVRETDVNGTSYVYSYDEYDRNISLIVYDKTNNVLSETYTEYDDVFVTVDGTFLKMTVKVGNITEQRVTEYMFDNEGRLAQKHLVSGEERRIYRYEYDYAGNMICEISSTGLETKHDYDAFGNVIRTVHPDGTEEFFEYDYAGNCIMTENGEGEKVYYTFDSLSRNIKTEIPDGERVNEFKTYYDYRGNTVKEENAEGNISVYTYNERGFLETSEQYSAGKDGIKTEYTYDGEGNITQMSYGAIGETQRISHKYVLDKYGRCIKEIDNLGSETEYEYDSLGNVLYMKDRNGIVTKYEYDGLSRLTEQINDKNKSLFYEYNPFGETISVSDGKSSQKLKYNGFGEVTAVNRDMTSDYYAYDEEGRLAVKQITDKDMGMVENIFTYDDRGNITSIETGMGVEYLTYDKAGRIIKKENSQSGISKTYSYYPTGLVKDVLTWQKDEIVYTESYEYDKNGNKIYEDLNGKIKRYSYDGMGRLKSVTDKDGNLTEYEFDGFGNISKEYDISERGIKTKQYFYDNNNRLIMSDSQSETIQYEYDDAGNLIEATTGYGGRIKKTYYRYDGYNRLNEYISDDVISEYTYNLDGLRESKTVGGKYTRFMYDGGNIIGELTEGNYYIYHRGTELIGSESYDGKSYYFRQDSHGNVTGILDVFGNEVKNYSYNPYGGKENVRLDPMGDRTIIYQWKAETDKIYNPFGFCGEYFDEETGLIYLRNRYYNPNTGRFISEDPIKDGLNWYVYANCNPIRYIDPSGYISQEEINLYNKGLLSNEIKNILVDLGNRWLNAKTQDARDEIHSLANMFRNNNYQYEDLTDKANAQLKENGQMIYDNVIMNRYPLCLTLPTTGITWYNLVENGGEWDYKVKSADWMPKEGYFMMDGKLISKADYGNLNYGYTGTILGLSPETLYKAAGYVQTGKINDDESEYYGDSEIDYKNVRKGIKWAQNEGHQGWLDLPVKLIIDVMRR